MKVKFECIGCGLTFEEEVDDATTNHVFFECTRCYEKRTGRDVFTGRPKGEAERHPVIRFDKELLEKILEGRKTTTWRPKPKRGIFEVAVGGSWYRPNRTGILVELEPIAEVSFNDLCNCYYRGEGFESPKALRRYLEGKYPRGVPIFGWLHKVRVYEG